MDRKGRKKERMRMKNKNGTRRRENERDVFSGQMITKGKSRGGKNKDR